MPALSERARLILERMEPERRYDMHELRGFVPDTGVEDFRETMHELWVRREVERVGHAAWRRRSSAPPDERPAPHGHKLVTAEELFDHSAFADFFK